MTTSATKTVCVLLLSYNGVKWIGEQIESILSQSAVSVRLFISDDGSTDGTVDLVRKLSNLDPRISILPPRNGSPNLFDNFSYGFSHLPSHPDYYYALSDQDDVWVKNKLERQIAYLQETKSQGVSSNVLSFRNLPGKDSSKPRQTKLIKKDYPKKQFDYLLEAPGPASTFLLDFDAFTIVKQYLLESTQLDYQNLVVKIGRNLLLKPGRKLEKQLAKATIHFHDWFIYALIRSGGLNWNIEPYPLVFYRQHDDNHIGANQGLSARLERLTKLRNGFYRCQFYLTGLLALGNLQNQIQTTKTVDNELIKQKNQLERILYLLGRTDWLSRIRLFFQMPKLRRRPRDLMVMSLLLLLGQW